MLDVLTIGTATRDIFLTSQLFKVVHDPEHLERLGFPTGEAQCFALGGKIEVGKPIETVGGGAANAAVTFARQGLKTAALVKIGKDENGAAVLREFRREGIASLAATGQKLGTAYSVILLSPSGERTILNYRGASEFLAKSDIPPALRSGARWAYISPGRIHPGVIYSLLRILKRRGMLIAMNPSRHYLELGIGRLKRILGQLDVVILNREEAAYLTGFHYREDGKIFRKFDEITECLAVMTDGSKGVLISDGKALYQAGTFRERRLVDRTGAGDAFGSGFVSGLAEMTKIKTYRACKHDRGVIEYAIRLGSANATSVVEHIGAQEGILSKRDFLSAPRFKKLHIRERSLV